MGGAETAAREDHGDERVEDAERHAEAQDDEAERDHRARIAARVWLRRIGPRQ